MSGKGEADSSGDSLDSAAAMAAALSSGDDEAAVAVGMGFGVAEPDDDDGLVLPVGLDGRTLVGGALVPRFRAFPHALVAGLAPFVQPAADNDGDVADDDKKTKKEPSAASSSSSKKEEEDDDAGADASGKTDAAAAAAATGGKAEASASPVKRSKQEVGSDDDGFASDVSDETLRAIAAMVAGRRSGADDSEDEDEDAAAAAAGLTPELAAALKVAEDAVAAPLERVSEDTARGLLDDARTVFAAGNKMAAELRAMLAAASEADGAGEGGGKAPTTTSKKTAAEGGKDEHDGDSSDDVEDARTAESGATFFIRADSAPRCTLERLALEIFRFHSRETYGAYDPSRSGAEWWIQIHDCKDSLAWHWVRDYALEDNNIVLQPHISTVTYLSGAGSPMLVVPQATQLELDNPMIDDEHCDRMFVSLRRAGGHMAFDGQHLHGAPNDFGGSLSEIVAAAGGAASLETGVSGHPAGTPTDRVFPEYPNVDCGGQAITLHVNAWFNHTPLNPEPLPAEVVSQLSNVPREAVAAALGPAREVKPTKLEGDEAEAAPGDEFLWQFPGGPEDHPWAYGLSTALPSRPVAKLAQNGHDAVMIVARPTMFVEGGPEEGFASHDLSDAFGHGGHGGDFGDFSSDDDDDDAAIEAAFGRFGGR